MEIMKKLKEKFLENELEFRIGSMNSDKTMALALPYVQARAIQNRLIIMYRWNLDNQRRWSWNDRF